MITPMFLREIFLEDPLLYDQIVTALNDGDVSLLRFKEINTDALKKTGLKKNDISDRINISVEKKAWLLRSLKERSQIKASITKTEKEKLLKGMLLTRATDNALKQLFLSGEITYESRAFQGKGFRSLGQEAIYGAPLRLKIGSDFLDNGIYRGDIAAPLIRDLGIFLAMSNHDVATALNAQAGKCGAPCDGRDLHLGDFQKGIVIPAAPLAIATSTLIGLALSFKLKKEPRVALSFIGEGGSSLGEWHEAINFAAVHRLPIIFCIENNQRALSTPTNLQCRARSFADKAVGYGINSLTIDGNDVEEIASAFKFGAEDAREGFGPILIEVVTMRMCGHAHHDDMLYLGVDPKLDFDIKPPKKSGYVDFDLYEEWRAKDPLKRYETQLIEENVVTEKIVSNMKRDAQNQVLEAISEIKARPWPRFLKSDQELVFKNPWVFIKKPPQITTTNFCKDGMTYLQAISESVRRAFLKHKNCFMIGEDVAPPYGNAFMMFKTVMDDFADRFINAPISENAIVSACVGMAMGGMRPIGEMQFNDFAACAMDQIVNNAAKSYFRLDVNLPMVLRMPYGGLRRAGPYHSQDTSPWFYRTHGLKIMAPSTPIDAFLMLEKAVDDDDPVLFYEHIALYRDPRLRQQLSKIIDASIDGAALLHAGSDLTLISYGAYSHVAKNAAVILENRYQKYVDVLDLRYLMPVDFDGIYASIKKTSRALLVGEDAKTGGILESIASKISEELFCFLDAPVTVLGSRDIPVPYAPSLEDDYLLTEQQIIDGALKLLAF